ncbi:oligosaccharide flippase family protein [Fundicoccus culcitae]|uniref:Oligosaccharide flippase family protein n=1 Tax=Fundicoccus culcitae TaxID=2969821 RepID=A0ABY5P6L8_9LACT|nr:oligosaccharide flippase family protein [Fundicoccus culcitae]UUX34388.1 oligosaccharide flippase family protein [Fundicoccus culcitae]
MRNNFNSQDDESDLEKTIQFTEDDLKQLRSPNRQPLDGDYFTNSQSTKDDDDNRQDNSVFESDKEEEWEADSPLASNFENEAENEEDLYEDELLDDSYDEAYYTMDSTDDEPIERTTDTEPQPLGKSVDWDHGFIDEASLDEESQMGDWDNEVLEHPSDEVTPSESDAADVSEPEENPFVYHSIRNKLKESIEEEKTQDFKEREERKKNSFFKTLFSKEDEVRYSTHELDDLDDYNQFNSETEDLDEISEEATPEYDVFEETEAVAEPETETETPVYNEDAVTIDDYEEDIYSQVSAANTDFQMDDFLDEEPIDEPAGNQKPSFFSRVFKPTPTSSEDDNEPIKEEVSEDDISIDIEVETSELSADTPQPQEKMPRKGKKAKKKKRRKQQPPQINTSEPTPEGEPELTPEVEDGETDDFETDSAVVQEEVLADIDNDNDFDTYPSDEDEIQTDEADDLSQQAKAYGEKVSQATAQYSEPLITDQSLSEVRGQDDLTIESKAEDQIETNFTKGAAWLSIGNIVSRIIGALYVIPWASMFGEDYTRANTLYSVGYKPYSLFLAIATAGFPSAIAKQMSFYHSKKEYRVADKLFKNSMYIMIGTGLVSALILYIAAPFLSSMSATDDPAAGTIVIRSLTPALLILPAMSLLRGYFQGFDDMIPTAVSQILEQFVRVIYLLVATYAIMQVLSGTVTTAVAHSTFAAFVGALVSLLYLLFVYWRKRPLIKELIKESADNIELDFKQSGKIMIMDSIPFVILGSGIILAQIVDTYSFRQIIQATSTMLLSEISELYGVLSLDVDKLVMIIISLAIAIASSSVPSVTSLFAQKDYPRTSRLIQNIVTVFSFVMLPAAVGLASIANNMYFFFYPMGNEQGPTILVLGAYLSIVLGAYTILSTILQSMNFRRVAVKYLLIGLLIKVVLQFPFVSLLHANGAQLATLFAFLFTTAFMWIKIHRTIIIDYASLAKDLVVIVVSTALMGISTSLWNTVLDMLFGPVGRLLTFVKILIVVLIGMFIYLGIMALFGKLNIILGSRFKSLQDKLQVFY